MASRTRSLLAHGPIMGAFAALALTAPAIAQVPTTAAPPATSTTTPGTAPALGATPSPATPSPATPVTPNAGAGHRAAVAAPSGHEEARVDQRIADLHKRLKITPQEESAWTTFADVMRGNARDMDSSYQDRSTQLAALNAVDNMQSYAKITEQHAQNVQKLIGPFTALYQSMSPDQQRAADQLFRNYAEQREKTNKRG